MRNGAPLFNLPFGVLGLGFEARGRTRCDRKGHQAHQQTEQFRESLLHLHSPSLSLRPWGVAPFPLPEAMLVWSAETVNKRSRCNSW